MQSLGSRGMADCRMGWKLSVGIKEHQSDTIRQLHGQNCANQFFDEPAAAPGAELAMLKFSKKVDYGLILLSKMQREAYPASARELAKRYFLPGPMVANVLKALAQAALSGK